MSAPPSNATYGATCQCLPADRFHKPVDHFCDEFCANFRSPDFRRVSVLAGIPVTTLLLHCGDGICVTKVDAVKSGTLVDFLNNV